MSAQFWIGFGVGMLFLTFVSMIWALVEMGRDEGPEQETGDDVLPPILTTPFPDQDAREDWHPSRDDIR